MAGVAAVGLVLALAARGASTEKATVIEPTQIPCPLNTTPDHRLVVTG